MSARTSKVIYTTKGSKLYTVILEFISQITNHRKASRVQQEHSNRNSETEVGEVEEMWLSKEKGNNGSLFWGTLGMTVH